MLTNPLLSIGFLAAFFVMACALAGWGRITGWLCRISFLPETNREELILTGMPCLFLLAGIWNIFLPVSRLFVVLFSIIGCTAYLWKRQIRRTDVDFFFLFSSLFFLALCFVSAYSYDTYLYYIDTIRWINEYAAVPGLANLHSRLGFNQFYFYLPAVFEAVFPGKGLALANPFLAWIFLNLFWNAGKLEKYGALSILAAGCVLALSMTGTLSAAQPDCCSDLFQLFLLCAFYLQLAERRDGRFPFFLLFSAVAVMTKLSNSVLCLVILIILFVIEKNKKTAVLFSMPFVLFLGIVWCARSVILTGYFVYPLSILYLDTAWRLPKSALKGELMGITGWSRMPGECYLTAAQEGVSYWLPDWIRTRGKLVFTPYVQCFAAGLLVLFAAGKKVLSGTVCFIMIPIAASMAFWFVSAPDPRFITGILFFIAIFPFGMLAENWILTRKRIILTLAAVAFIMAPTSSYVELCTWRFGLLGGFPPRVWRNYEIRHTDSGLPVSVVKDSKYGDGPFSGKPPLPAAPELKPGLSLRGKTLQDGFLCTDNNNQIKTNTENTMTKTFHPTTGASICGRKLEFFHHPAKADWGGPDQVDSFAVLHPKKRVAKPGLYVVFHSAGHDLYSCLSCTIYKNNHDIYRTPDDMYGLYLDCREHEPEDFWWGGINARGEGNPDRRTRIQPVEKRCMDTIFWTLDHYPVDPQRVYACGNSMGGSGALGLALCRGDVFAAIKVNVPAGVRHCADRCYLDQPVPEGIRLPDPPVCIDYSAQNDSWSDGHEILFRGMEARKYALFAYWAPFGHANNDNVMLPLNDLIHSLDWLSIRKDQAYPVFTGADCNDPIPWPDHRDSKAAGQLNAFFRWKNVADSSDSFRMELFLVTPEQLKTSFRIPEKAAVNVSIRRLQKFKVRPGSRIAWRFGAESGVVTVDPAGLVTIPQLTLTDVPRILTLTHAEN